MGGPTDEGFDTLSVAEQILRLQDLWDRIAEHPEDLELSEAERAELDRRLDAHAAAPDQAAPWPAVRARLRAPR